MRSPYDFIVKPVDGRRYANSKDIGGVEVYTSVSDEDHTSANRFGEVIALPLDYDGPIEIGYVLLVHHNVFKFYNDMQGEQKSGRSYFRDGLFFIDDMQYYMYNDGESWHTVGKYSFVTPIETVHEEGKLRLNVAEVQLQGVMLHPSYYMLSMGVNIGDTVTYYPGMNYEFIVEDERMYRLMDRHITVKL